MNKKQRVFVEEYLTCWNATEAARRAGYAHPNKQGPRLLVNVGVEEEVKRRIEEKAMAADEVLIRLADQARSNIGDYITGIGGIDVEKVIDQGHLVKSYNISPTSRKIELHSSQRALELLGKHHALFIERREISGPKGGAITIVNWDDDKDDTD